MPENDPSLISPEERRKNAERRALRPYRVTLYVLYLVFAFTFIGLVARSLAKDLFASPTEDGQQEASSVEACVDELEWLFGRLAARSAFPTTPDEYRDWDEFTRTFEDRLQSLSRRCVIDPASPEEEPLRQAIAESAAQLETWRQHLSRCGEEGEEERSRLVESISRLRLAAKRVPQ